MRVLASLCFLVFVMFSSGCGLFVISDKWNHFAFSASIASVGTVITEEPLESVAFTVGAGLLKEIYDELYGSGFQIWDLAADMAGAAAGGFVAAEIYMEEFP